MRDYFEDRVLLVFTALLVLFVGFLVLLPFTGRAKRRIHIVGGKEWLARAYMDYTNTGSFTDTNCISLSSNTVTIGSNQYHCLLQLRSPSFADEGTLAMTSNHVYIWLDSNGPPKIIPLGYRPPLFGY